MAASQSWRMPAPARLAERWDEYLLLSRQPLFRRRLEAAHEILARAITMGGTWAAGVSGGKDSTALAGLLVESGWRGPLLHFRYPETPDENTELVRGLAARWDLPLHIVEVEGAWDVFAKAGRAFVSAETAEERAATSSMLSGYGKAVEAHTVQEGWTGQFWGLRREESRPRRIMLASKGPLYQVESRSGWTCCPLAGWRSADVWAFTASRDMPHLSRYDTASDPERERSEITWLACESLWSHGMVARLKMERPDEYNELLARFPILSIYH